MSLNADLRNSSAIIATVVKVGLVGCLGAFSGYLYSAVNKTNRKLTVIAFAIFPSLSIVVTSLIYKKAKALRSRELCAVSACWNSIEAVVVIFLFRKLGLIAFKGTCLIGSVYASIVGSRIKGYRDPQHRQMVYLDFFEETKIE